MLLLTILFLLKNSTNAETFLFIVLYNIYYQIYNVRQPSLSLCL